MWMVRAGEGGYLFEEFTKKKHIAIGWDRLADLTPAKTRDAMREMYTVAYSDSSPAKAAIDVGMLYKFRSVLSQGDLVITYSPEDREYLLGTVDGDYEFRPGLIRDSAHVRKVTWKGRISRDRLSAAARNSLGSVLTLFAISPDYAAELLAALNGPAKKNGENPGPVVDDDDLTQVKEDAINRAHELIKDKILALSPENMERLAAALLRAMGYRTRITPKGPDRGVDVVASPDGLGLEEPRIKVEVKHRTKTSMGADEIRSFLGGLRGGDRGLYVSTGGYSKEARYEADRASVPVTLLGLDDLATYVVSHYDNFDTEGRVLLPLVRVYWPAE
jgi:restriction system protein